jgi:hypothetical protein
MNARLVTAGDELHFTATVVTRYSRYSKYGTLLTTRRDLCIKFSPLAVSDIAKFDKKLTSLETEINSLRALMRGAPLPDPSLPPELALLATIPRFEVWLKRSRELVGVGSTSYSNIATLPQHPS